MKEADEMKMYGLPAQLVREVLRAAATGVNEIPASRYVVIPESVAAWLTALLNRHPDVQVRTFFRNELETLVEVDENGEAVASISDNPFIGLFAGDWPDVDPSDAGDAQPGEPGHVAEAAGHWDAEHKRFYVDTFIGARFGQSLN